MKLIFLAKFAILLCLSVNSHAQLFSALNSQPKQNSPSLFGSGRSLFSFKQNNAPLPPKNNIVKEQPTKPTTTTNSLFEENKPSPKSTSLFENDSHENTQNFVVPGSAPNLLKNKKPSEPQPQQKTEIQKKIEEKTNKEAQVAEVVNVEDIGKRNLKKLEKITKLTENLINSEKVGISNVIEDWKKINNKTSKIGKVLGNEFSKMDHIQDLNKIDQMGLKLKEVQGMIDLQKKELTRVKEELAKYNKLLLSKKSRSRFFKDNIREVDEIKVEDVLKLHKLEAKRLVSNEITLGDTQFSDSLVNLPDNYVFSLNGDGLTMKDLFSQEGKFRELVKKCGENFSKCLQSEADLESAKEKNVLISKTLHTIEKRISKLRHHH